MASDISIVTLLASGRILRGVKNVRHRRSVRLPGYDYAQPGAYFVTVVTYQRACLFLDDRVKAIANEVWRTVAGGSGPLDEFVVMPNHVHGILWITNPNAVGAQQQHRMLTVPRSIDPTPASTGQRDGVVAAPLQRHAFAQRLVEPGSLSALVRTFKSATAKRINRIRGTSGAPLWQRNYYEHVIRDEDDLARVRQYIVDNPAKWDEDPLNPASKPSTAGKAS